ncbi:MAG TPA: hypothetical protein VEQ85_10940, partial [Lacipirellulaceae bacterium]|nr:hypothetical protein [Lacipirellulaceae bacterium]
AGEHWFLHFQDLGAYGRVVHLNPMRWEDDWPVMGQDMDGNGVGEPLEHMGMPKVAGATAPNAPQTSDEFDGALGLQWQWQANPQPGWASLVARPGWLRLHGGRAPAGDLSDEPRQLLQKLPAPNFMATTLVEFSKSGSAPHEARAGLVVMGQTYAGLMVSEAAHGPQLTQITGGRPGAPQAGPQPEHVVALASGLPPKVWLRVTVEQPARCTFSYSTDGERFTVLGEPFTATPGHWMGAKVGIVCQGDGAVADFESFTIE